MAKKKKKKLNETLQAWVDARRRHHLSHAQVQMARELGMNPKKLRGLDNHRQEPWKMPLRAYIQDLYFKRFGKQQPDSVLSVEEVARLREAKKARRREARREAREAREEAAGAQPTETDPAPLEQAPDATERTC